MMACIGYPILLESAEEQIQLMVQLHHTMHRLRHFSVVRGEAATTLPHPPRVVLGVGESWVREGAAPTV
jgi:hypothetical protein